MRACSTSWRSPWHKLNVGDAAHVAEDQLQGAPLGEVYGVGQLVRDPGPGPQPTASRPTQSAAPPCCLVLLVQGLGTKVAPHQTPFVLGFRQRGLC